MAEGGQDEAWRRFLGSGRSRWPEFEPSQERLLEIVRGKLGGPVPDSATLGNLDAGELWLAAACLERNAAAVRLFDATYVKGLGPALAATKLDESEMDEVKQRVRRKLLDPDEHGAIKLVEYSGQGRLGALTRVVAMRMAIDFARVKGRNPQRHATADALAVERLMDERGGPESGAIRREHQGLVKTAFENAVAALDTRERGVLRLHLIERVSIDEIAALHRVHRATAARWVAKIRDRIAERTHATLREQLGLDSDALDGLLLAVDSRLDLSLSRVVKAGDGPA